MAMLNNQMVYKCACFCLQTIKLLDSQIADHCVLHGGFLK